MKRLTFLLAAVLCITASHAQIRIASAAKPTPDITAKYDSTQNYLFPGVQSIYSYVGQDFIFVHSGAFIYLHSSSNVGSTCSIRPKFQDELIGKVFHVDSVYERDGTLGVEYILKLHGIESGKVLYYLYPNYESSFPFLCVGYKEKYDRVHSQLDGYIRQHIRHWNKVDFETGERIEWGPLTIWKYKEYIYDPHHGYAALYGNDNGQTIAIYNDDDVVSTVLYEGLESKYGKSLCLYAIRGLIQKGMPDVLLTIAWGNPNKVDTDPYGEYWIYDSNIVRIENGKVKSWSSM